LTIRINKQALESACKEIIETILFCLPDAFKGTVYQIGAPPHITAERVTSGIIDEEKQHMSWGLPESSDYNPPGKTWLDYRDQPDRPLEAMAWCVERQKSWTSENPATDQRSVRLQTDGIWEDYHHMEPVLIRKKDLFAHNHNHLDYPRNYQGQTLWEDTEYVVVAVIKIHFRPKTIKIGSSETRLIKRLSRAFGTELLSYQLREESIEAMNQLAQDKLDSCNILADSLRNAIAKSGIIFSLIKLELGFLRIQWEKLLFEQTSQKNEKREAILELDSMLQKIGENAEGSVRQLMDVQKKFLSISLPPKVGEDWVGMQIESRWKRLLEETAENEELAASVNETLEKLKKSLHHGKDPVLVGAFDFLPEPLKKEWVELIYHDLKKVDFTHLERVINILDNPSLALPFKEKSRKSLIHLKTLFEIMGQLENSTNNVLQQLLNGSKNGHCLPTTPSNPLVSCARA
jgi:hypothetical protein